MGELIPGLNDAADAEYTRIRNELSIALAESEYTIEQAATFAGVSVGTLRNALSGPTAVGIDKLIRILFAVGGRIEIVRPEGEGARPFQVVPSDPSSTGLPDSSKSTHSRRTDQAHDRRSAASKKGSEQHRKGAPRKRDTRGWVAEAA